MTTKHVTTSAMTQNATETTETEHSSPVVVPGKVSRLIGVGLQIAMAGMTTLEGISGVLRLKSDTNGLPGGDQVFPIGSILPLTSGAVCCAPYIHPCDIEVVPGTTITPCVTFDTALTINPKWRCHLVFA